MKFIENAGIKVFCESDFFRKEWEMTRNILKRWEKKHVYSLADHLKKEHKTH